MGGAAIIETMVARATAVAVPSPAPPAWLGALALASAIAVGCWTLCRARGVARPVGASALAFCAILAGWWLWPGELTPDAVGRRRAAGLVLEAATGGQWVCEMRAGSIVLYLVETRFRQDGSKVFVVRAAEELPKAELAAMHRGMVSHSLLTLPPLESFGEGHPGPSPDLVSEAPPGTMDRESFGRHQLRAEEEMARADRERMARRFLGADPVR